MLVSQLLTDAQVSFQSFVHAPAFTAQRRARHLCVPGRQVAKGVLLVGPDGYFLGVLPATHLVDLEALTQHLNGRVRLACWREIIGICRNCEWGAVAPFGKLYGLPTVLDESIAPNTEMVLEGNTHFEAIRLHVRDFERLEQPRRLRFARRS